MTGHADVSVPRSFGFRFLPAHAEDLGVFLLLSVLCVLSICTCGHFLGGGWFHSAFVPPRLHFRQSQGTPFRTF